MVAVDSMAVAAVSTAVGDFMAGVASEAEWDQAAGFVAPRSAEERDFAAARSAAASAVMASVAVFAAMAFAAVLVFADVVGVGEDGAGASDGAGRIGTGPDTRIRTDILTLTRGGPRLITRPAMILTTILTTTLRPPTRIEIHTAKTGT